MSKEKVTDKLGRELKVGDIIAWPIASNSGTLHFALVRGFEDRKHYYYETKVLTKIVVERSVWNSKERKYIDYPKKVMDYYMFYHDRGIIVTEQLVSNPPENEDIKMLLKAREELLNA